MRRLFWLGVGVAVGAVAVRKLTRTAEAYTPHGIAASLQSSAVRALDSVREFVADVRDGMDQREDQIHQAVAEADAAARDHRHSTDSYRQEGEQQR